MSGSSFKVRVIETSILFYINHLSTATFASLNIFFLWLFQIILTTVDFFLSFYINYAWTIFFFCFYIRQPIIFFFCSFITVSFVLQFFFCLFVSILFSFLFLYFILNMSSKRNNWHVGSHVLQKRHLPCDMPRDVRARVNNGTSYSSQ